MFKNKNKSEKPQKTKQTGGKILFQLLLSVLPITILGFIVLVSVATYLSIQNTDKLETQAVMAELQAESAKLSSKMHAAENTTSATADLLGVILSSNDSVEINSCIESMERTIKDNDGIVALGFFLESDAAKKVEKPYYYLAEKDGKIELTDLGEDYDYTQTSWYQSAKETKKPTYTETYTDTAIGILMTSYIVPILDNDGNFIGAVNTDIDMSFIQEIIDGIQIGESGYATLISWDGFMLSSDDKEDILTVNIADIDGLKEHAEYIENENNLSGSFRNSRNGAKQIVFFKRFTDYQWILMLSIPQQELFADTYRQINVNIIVCIIAIALLSLSIYLQAKSISKPISIVKDMSIAMSNGDLSIDKVKIKSRNEVGEMTDALNEMLDSNKEEMSLISDNSKTISENCNILKSAVNELDSSFNEIREAIQTISSAMMDNSATTQQLTSSVAEVKSSIGQLSNKASDSETMSKEIKVRAKKVGESSVESFNNAMELSEQFQKRLETSIDNSKVVNDIDSMAVIISDIAEQITLLSLNASIEAARAGENGKGFAVVASEIGNLANQTSDTVSNIQGTVSKVRESVSVLSKDSSELINFINEHVTPDYKSLIDVSTQYEEDATSIEELASYLAEISGQLKTTMEQVSNAINNIATASQSAAEDSKTILDNVETVASEVNNINDISAKQLEISEDLDNVVSNYKFE
ncbi:methyl-accepting chemotaxis sensory transducer with Cache sensor [Acetitomaculum ruminis DSM 5522]|uniref:Methyl-accepting chemotaxis sensory transducer with Cache sensor n=1 Tax=Acetitomaculum ruminis DSM 5522 TaxID=1120918 RepID=A0A1I0V0V2_9FIRM|nr:methyl-accepting chemotaxis protein [Acetitomaculum ruminis]SFA69979.1 methyl-accepting chemotaxis sensory transducer with Cache sensor [Acetitomaculum ruminis DSM 5522]